MKVFLLRLLWVVLLILLLVGLIVGMAFVFEAIAPADYLFYEQNAIVGYLLMVVLVVPAFYVADRIINIISKRWGLGTYDTFGMIWFGQWLGKGKIAVAVVWFVGLYCCFTSATYVTPNQIVVTNPLNPGGTTYEYTDVEQIETGFGSKTFSFYEYKKKGDFFYKITLDGKDVVFHAPSVTSDIPRYEDSYLELEEFDEALTQLDIPKKSSEEHYEHCDYDQQYVERFLRIVRNTK